MLFYKTFQQASLDFLSLSRVACKADPLLRQYFSLLLTAVLSLYFVCVFKAGPWTDNYARVPKSFTCLSVNLGHVYPDLSLVSPHGWAWLMHVLFCKDCRHQLLPGVSGASSSCIIMAWSSSSQLNLGLLQLLAWTSFTFGLVSFYSLYFVCS